jgi:hypothetical protein
MLMRDIRLGTEDPANTGLTSSTLRLARTPVTFTHV